MVIETDDQFTFEKKAALDKENQKVQEWENEMLKFQQLIPGTESSGKWVVMNKIFCLTAS
jgi:L-rhamnose mutarotase